VARLRAALLLFLAVAATAHAEWSILSANSEPGHAGILHQHVLLENASAGERAVIDLAIFSTKSCTLRVIQNEDGASNLAGAMTRGKCLAGVNGGYFDSNYVPIGLLIVDGKVFSPLQRARLLGGVLMASSRGVQIVRAGEYSRRPNPHAAIQCGPFLVDLGQRVRGLEATREARRTFAAIDRDGHAGLGFCSEISLAQLSAILAGGVSDFKIDRALNLDGGSSSAFWFAPKDGSAFSIPEQKTVRDFVAVVAR
jgi:hypothetical protein